MSPPPTEPPPTPSGDTPAQGPRTPADLERERVRLAARAGLFGSAESRLRIGRFEVTARIGQGAWGIVYSAVDPALHREVAIKLVAGAVDLRQVLAEARALARLTHPNVLTVFEAGEHEGVPFIVSELVRGGTLRAWLAERPRRTEEIVDVLLGVGRGLEAAHLRGLVHRDVKPENVLIGHDGRPRVSDFGLAVSASDPSPPAGTRSYMAPEQAEGRFADPLSDQFSFATMAHEAIFGALPQASGDADARHPALARVLSRGIAPAPEARHASMGALVEALEKAARRRSARPLVAAGVLSLLAISGSAYAYASHVDAQASEAEARDDEERAERAARKRRAQADARTSPEYVARLAAEDMMRGDWARCLERLEGQTNAAVLVMRVDCARKVSTAALRDACRLHLEGVGEAAPGCDERDFEAIDHQRAGRHEACVRAIAPSSFDPQRNILMNECARGWGTLEARRIACEFARKGAPAPPGAVPCDATKELESQLEARKKNQGTP
jgi:hypothetical protein